MYIYICAYVSILICYVQVHPMHSAVSCPHVWCRLEELREFWGNKTSKGFAGPGLAGSRHRLGWDLLHVYILNISSEILNYPGAFPHLNFGWTCDMQPFCGERELAFPSCMEKLAPWRTIVHQNAFLIHLGVWKHVQGCPKLKHKPLCRGSSLQVHHLFDLSAWGDCCFWIFNVNNEDVEWPSGIHRLLDFCTCHGHATRWWLRRGSAASKDHCGVGNRLRPPRNSARAKGSEIRHDKSIVVEEVTVKEDKGM